MLEERTANESVVKHDRSILHLDLKPGNVLLTWEEGKLMYVVSWRFKAMLSLAPCSPRAMLSDFGTSRDMMRSNRVRSGNTGTYVLLHKLTT